MIPKIIHYCWFGRGKMPKLAKKCIKSWKKYCPDYEIKEWNEDNFDINIIPYVKEAYEAKKYAFVSDYARFWILYHYGGLYFDTDVEIIRPITHIVENGAFMGCEDGVTEMTIVGGVKKNVPPVAAGLGLGCPPWHMIYREILDYYASIHFSNPEGALNTVNTVVTIVTSILLKHDLKSVDSIQECAGLTIYPKEYFSPISWKTGEMIMTEKTVSIHHFAGSWLPKDIQRRLREESFKKRHRYLYDIYYYFYKKPKSLIFR